jgi:hypothetical protein
MAPATGFPSFLTNPSITHEGLATLTVNDVVVPAAMLNRLFEAFPFSTDINAALAYCEQKIEHPAKTHLLLITDLYEGGDAKSMLARVAALKQSGVNLIVLLALSDEGHQAITQTTRSRSPRWIARYLPALPISFLI